MTMHQKVSVLIFIEVVVVGIYERCAHVRLAFPRKWVTCQQLFEEEKRKKRKTCNKSKRIKETFLREALSHPILTYISPYIHPTSPRL